MAAQTEEERPVLKAVRQELDLAQNELESAEIELLQAISRQAAASRSVLQLEGAVAALSGEPPTAATKTDDRVDDGHIRAYSAEEWEKEQARKRRVREKELAENNPLAHLKCSGCGQGGTLNETYAQSSGGAPVRMLICASCGNQSF